MTTTMVRDSVVGDAWIRQTLAACPVQPVNDPKTGQPTGDFILGPVRLAFFDAFKLSAPSPENENPKFGGHCLFTPEHDLTLLYNEMYRVAWETFKDKYDETTQQYHGIRLPFRNQAEKSKFGGYTPGAMFISATSQYKPPIVDIRGNPIVDESKVYPGVWAIPTVNCYAYLNKTNPGIAFGLQSLMIIGDDTNTAGGGAADPQKQYAQIKGAISAPAISAAQLGNMPQGGQAPTPPMVGGAHGMPPGAAPQPPAYSPPVGAPPAPPVPGMAAPVQDTPEQAELRAMGLLG